MPDQIGSYWDLVEPIFEKVDTGSPSDYLASISTIPRPVVFLYAAHFSLSEIHNGGLLQFFWNSTGVMAPEAIQGFAAIGMHNLASMLTNAATKLGAVYPRDRDERWDALLMASGLSEKALKSIFEGNENLYIAFTEATEPLNLESMNKEIWSLAKTENGGFQRAATSYAQRQHPIQ